MKKSTHKIFRFFIRLLLGAIARVEMRGIEHMPKGGFVVAGNHIGRLDAALGYYVLDRPDIIMMVAEKYSRYAFFRWLVRLTNGIFVDRYNADIHAIRETLRRLKQGQVFTITPEGTRSKSGNLQQARPGAIYLAWKAGVPVLPVSVTGTEDAEVSHRLKHFRRLNIIITAGAPFNLPAEEKEQDRSIALQKFTDEVMCRIAALLPVERRGFYADHPRLKQLLDDQAVIN